ncbi:MAG: transcriptional regulator PpsR [Geminicoccaceae bacterium]
MNSSAASISQPDVTLFLDLEGVIQKVSLSSAVRDESIEAWVGRPWIDTVGKVGADKVRRMVDEARTSGVSAFRQIAQLFPSGLELPMEYTTVRLGTRSGLVAIGKNLLAVAELQSRLVAAQQAMERDYWKLREVETRYRHLFDSSNDAVLMVRATNLRIVEANPVAIRALGLAPAGRDLLGEIALADREPFQTMLSRVREFGKAPAMLVNIGRDGHAWLVRASLMMAEPGPILLLQMSPVGGAHPAVASSDPNLIEDLVERLPDGFVVTDDEGVIIRANRMFLGMVQTNAEGSVIGERLGRWLGRPGADVAVLLSNLNRNGVVRLFATTVQGDLGAEREVEVSAAGNAERGARRVGLLIRDISRRDTAPTNASVVASMVAAFGPQLGKTSLRALIKDTVGAVERQYIEATLELTRGNRTAAAELLGLSRQSLYQKLNRYGLDGSGEGAQDTDG